MKTKFKSLFKQAVISVLSMLMVLCGMSVMTTMAADETAFAVYSADDNSLTFYADSSVPSAESNYNGKTVTNVYTGFESTEYTSYSSVPWYSVRTSVVSVVFDESFADVKPTAMANWFYGFTGLTNIDVNYLDTSEVTTLYQTFYNCKKLTNLDALENWDTSKVTTLYNTFYSCSGITSLDALANWDTSNVTTLYGAFQRCSSLTNVDALINWNVSNVTNLSNVFYGCSGLVDINGLSNWNTSKVTDLSYAFVNCTSLADINGLSNWDTPKVTTLYCTFQSCSSLTGLNALSNWNISNVTTLYYTFFSCSGITSLDALKNWDTDKVTTLKYTFYGCSGLTDLSGLSGWNTGNVTTLERAFYGCSGLTDISALSNWDTSNVTTLYQTFYNCTSLTNADGISNWDTSNVTTLYDTFYGCSSLTEIDVSKWDTSKVTDMQYVFYKCTNLEEIDISNWNTSKVTNMGYMFNGCSNLETIYSDDANFVTSGITSSSNGTSMFTNCSKLVGGNGTAYSDYGTANYTMAHVDTADNPGYFTQGHSEHDWVKAPEVYDPDTNTITVYFECAICGATKHETLTAKMVSGSGMSGNINISDIPWYELISYEELAQYDDDAVIDFVLVMEDINESVPASDAALIEELLEKEDTDAQIFYIEIDLSLVVTSGDTKVSVGLSEMNSPLTITVKIPDSLKTEKDGEYFVIRVHDNAAEKLDTTDNKDGTLTFSSDKFSTYAIAFAAEEDDEPTPDPGTTEPRRIQARETEKAQ